MGILNTLRTLHEAGAHFVLAYKTKRPLKAGWIKQPESLQATFKHVEKGGLVGIVPASIGAVVIDIDAGGLAAAGEVERALGQPAAVTVETARGYHAYYKMHPDAQLGNRKWELPAGSGDIRAAKGFVVLWDAERVAAILGVLRDSPPVNTALLPSPLKTPQDGAQGFVEGNRNENLNKAVYAAAVRGELTPEVEQQLARQAAESGLPPGEIADTVRSAKTAGAAQVRPALPLSATGLERALLGLAVQVRHNTRSALAEYAGESGEWRAVTDRAEASLREHIAARFTTDKGAAWAPYNALWRRYLDAVLHTREVDPFAEWLDGLPAWDQIPRIAHWLDTAFVLDSPGPLAEWAAQFIFFGAVWRTFEPGTKLDEMPVLIGPQGVGKSTALRTVLPPHIPGLFSDTLNFSGPARDRVEALQGRVIVEAAELAGVRGSDLEGLKSFLSRTDDGAVRLAYRRNPEPSPRRAIVVGTTNDSRPLPNDSTGNRRFVPVLIADGDVEAAAVYISEHREQMWAEAVALYRSGRTAHLPPALGSLQGTELAAYRDADELLEERIISMEAYGAMTLADIAQSAGMTDTAHEAARLPRREEYRLTKALRVCGWQPVRRMTDGERMRVWMPPEDD